MKKLLRVGLEDLRFARVMCRKCAGEGIDAGTDIDLKRYEGGEVWCGICGTEIVPKAAGRSLLIDLGKMYVTLLGHQSMALSFDIVTDQAPVVSESRASATEK